MTVTVGRTGLVARLGPAYGKPRDRCRDIVTVPLPDAQRIPIQGETKTLFLAASCHRHHVFSDSPQSDYFVVSPALSYASFGRSIATSGTTTIVGDPSQPNQISGGAAYVFDSTSGSLAGVLASLANARGAQFGTSVAINGNVIAVGAPWSNR